MTWNIFIRRHFESRGLCTRLYGQQQQWLGSGTNRLGRGRGWRLTDVKAVKAPPFEFLNDTCPYDDWSRHANLTQPYLGNTFIIFRASSLKVTESCPYCVDCFSFLPRGTVCPRGRLHHGSEVVGEKYKLTTLVSSRQSLHTQSTWWVFLFSKNGLKLVALAKACDLARS